MRVTRQMIEAARRGHYDYLQRNRLLGIGPFQPMPDPIIRAMLEAAIGDIVPEKPTAASAKMLVDRVVQRHTVEAIAKRKAAIKPVVAIVKAKKTRPKR
jgi:hypothetical protein